MPKKKVYIENNPVKKSTKTVRPSTKTIAPQASMFPDPQISEAVISSEEHFKRMTIPLGVKVKKTVDGREVESDIPVDISGYVCTVTKDDKGKYKVERNLIKNTEGLKDFLNTKEYKETKARESYPTDWFSLDLDGTSLANMGTGSPDNEYHPLLGGPFNKQQYLYDFLDSHSKCFEQKNHNPIIRRVVNMIADYVMGKGVKIQFKENVIQQAWDKFEKRTKFQEKMRTDCTQTVWAGEIMTHKTKTNGQPDIKQIDPSTVWEIVTLPEDIEQVFYFHRQFPTQYQLVYHAGDIVSKYIVEDIPADEVIHIKVNSVAGEKRGRSDIFSVIGWAKRLKDFYNAKIIKAQIEESFVLKRKVKGSATDVSSFANDPANNGVPPAGSQLWENEAIDTSYMNPSVSSDRGGDSIGEAIKSLIAIGVGLSPEQLGVQGQGSSRATALTKTEPSTKNFETRQRVMEDYIRQIVDWWLSQVIGKEFNEKGIRPAKLANIKSMMKKKDFKGLMAETTALMTSGTVKEAINTDYEVIFPELLTEDRSAKIKDIIMAQTQGVLSHETMANMIAKELAYTTYDYYDEMELREQSKINDPMVQGMYRPTPGVSLKTDAQQPAPKPNSSQSQADFKDQARQ